MENHELQQDVKVLILKELLGTLQEAERAELERWRRASAENEAVYEWLSKPENHEAEYRFRESVDVESALHDMKKRLRKSSAFSFLKYAAAVAVLIVGGAFAWYYQYTKVTPPEISEAVQIAMQQSRQSGAQAAVIEAVKIDENALNDETAKRHSTAFPASPLASMTMEELQTAHRITTRSDKEFFLTLDDGTLVHLNYDTRLIYPEKFGHGSRNVILDGEAYFMVAKDKSRPFIVHTSSGDVRVYGTEFNVSQRKSSPHASVVLVKGSVSVTPTGGKEQLIKPGQQLSISNSQVSVSEVDVAPYQAWNCGFFVFHEWTIGRIMDVLARWYDKKVVFASDELKQIKLSGNFYRYDNILPTMQALETVTGLSIRTEGNQFIIEK